MSGVNPYDELKYDLVRFTDKANVDLIVEWLTSEGLLDYDTLKEYYLDEEDEDEDDFSLD